MHAPRFVSTIVLGTNLKTPIVGSLPERLLRVKVGTFHADEEFVWAIAGR
jgi:hypothetical protein